MGRRSSLLKCSRAARSSASILRVKGILAMSTGYAQPSVMSMLDFDVTIDKRTDCVSWRPAQQGNLHK